MNHRLFTGVRLSQAPSVPARFALQRTITKEERACLEVTKRIASSAMKCHSDTWFLSYSGDSQVLSSNQLMRGLSSKPLSVTGNINHTAKEKFFMKGESLSGDFGSFYMNLLQERQWPLEQTKQSEKTYVPGCNGV